jgi:competence protein ComEC
LLTIHFLNVGHGDCTVIEFPSGRVTVIDINNSKVLDKESINELSEGRFFSEYIKTLELSEATKYLEENKVNFAKPIDPVEYIKNSITSSSIFRFILTHPDMDHMTGLYRIKNEGIDVVNFWDTDNCKEVDKNSVTGKYDYRDWETYQEWRTKEENPKTLRLYQGAEGNFFTDDGIKILSPTEDLVSKANEQENWNLLSYVLLIEYKGHKIVLGGDAEKEVWDDLAENHKELLENVSVLKAPHHGRESGYSENAVSIMSPTWTICSIGKKPEQDAHNKYRKHTKKKVLSTRFRGNIVVQISDSGELSVYSQYNSEPENDLYPLDSYGIKI